MAENGRKMSENCPKKRLKKRDEAPVSIDYTAHFARKIIKRMHLIREETKLKMALLKRKHARAKTSLPLSS
jgi:hypothetical protein